MVGGLEFCLCGRKKSSKLNLLFMRVVLFFQSMPVAASTISLLMLSLDRYATVKHPRLAQLREQRFLPVVLAFAAWFSAIILCVPILLAYHITSREDAIKKSLCKPDYGSDLQHIWFIAVHTLFVFIFPALGVILNHLGVRQKLCALSLTARAGTSNSIYVIPLYIIRITKTFIFGSII